MHALCNEGEVSLEPKTTTRSTFDTLTSQTADGLDSLRIHVTQRLLEPAAGTVQQHPSAIGGGRSGRPGYRSVRRIGGSGRCGGRQWQSRPGGKEHGDWGWSGCRERSNRRADLRRGRSRIVNRCGERSSVGLADGAVQHGVFTAESSIYQLCESMLTG